MCLLKLEFSLDIFMGFPLVFSKAHHRHPPVPAFLLVYTDGLSLLLLLLFGHSIHLLLLTVALCVLHILPAL